MELPVIGNSFRLHCDEEDEVCYKTLNPYSDETRYIYFISDVPHLMKTVRNCWSHSFGHGCTRKLWVGSYVYSYSYIIMIFYLA